MHCNEWVSGQGKAMIGPSSNKNVLHLWSMRWLWSAGQVSQKMSFPGQSSHSGQLIASENYDNITSKNVFFCNATIDSMMSELVWVFWNNSWYKLGYTGGKSSPRVPKSSIFFYVTASQWSCRYFSCGATCILYLGFSPNKKVSAKLSSVHKVIFVQGKQFSRASFWTLPK